LSWVGREGILDYTSRLTYKSDWHQVYVDSATFDREPSTHDLGTIVISSGLARQDWHAGGALAKVRGAARCAWQPAP
jgi:hypothetical protein